MTARAHGVATSDETQQAYPCDVRLHIYHAAYTVTRAPRPGDLSTRNCALCVRTIS